MSWVTFVEAEPFTDELDDYLTDDEFRAFQAFLSENPRYGKVILGSGGIRKVRWGDERSGKGKSGGTRILYLCLDDDTVIILLILYGKSERDDLTQSQLKLVSKRAKHEMAEWKKNRSHQPAKGRP